MKGDEIGEGRQQRNRDSQEKILSNINTCTNGWYYFSENLKIVALKLPELSRFAS